jgi:peptidoglycan/xylan/chitin deacetylase (PgdA/CDA1 family)
MSLAKLSIVALASVLVLRVPLAAEGKVIILDFHTFLGTGISNIDYSEKELADELDAMRAMGYRFVSLEDAIAGKVEGVANIVITIDDGNHTIYQAFKDVLEPRGIKPFLFIYPAIVLGHVRYALTPEQIRLLAQAGCGIGAHGYHHNPVTDKAWARNPKDFMREIEKPGPALARILGGPPPTMFAYPFGVYSSRAEDALKAAGYSWAFAGDDKVRQVDFADPQLDHMAVPRTITYRYARNEFMRELKKLVAYSGPPLFEEPAPVPPPAPAEPLPGDVAK